MELNHHVQQLADKLERLRELRPGSLSDRLDLELELQKLRPLLVNLLRHREVEVPAYVRALLLDMLSRYTYTIPGIAVDFVLAWPEGTQIVADFLEQRPSWDMQSCHCGYPHQELYDKKNSVRFAVMVEGQITKHRVNPHDTRIIN